MLTFAGTYVMKLMLYVGDGGGVGWGMLTFAGTYVMKLMLRWGARRRKLLAREVIHQDKSTPRL